MFSLANKGGAGLTEKRTFELEKATVTIEGNAIEVHLKEPLRFTRKHWVVARFPEVEAQDTMLYVNSDAVILDALTQLFQAVPQTDYEDT